MYPGHCVALVMNDTLAKKTTTTKQNKQRKKGTKIIYYSKHITIQYCMYSTMIRFIPGARFSQILATSRVIF